MQEGDSVSTPRGAARVLKVAGGRVRVELEGGLKTWVESKDIQVVASADEATLAKLAEEKAAAAQAAAEASANAAAEAERVAKENAAAKQAQKETELADRALAAKLKEHYSKEKLSVYVAEHFEQVLPGFGTYPGDQGVCLRCVGEDTYAILESIERSSGQKERRRLDRSGAAGHMVDILDFFLTQFQDQTMQAAMQATSGRFWIAPLPFDMVREVVVALCE